jgi:hypothetical protein
MRFLAKIEKYEAGGRNPETGPDRIKFGCPCPGYSDFSECTVYNYLSLGVSMSASPN